MYWEFIVVLIIAIPVILFPVAFIWYINFGGIYRGIQEIKRRRAVREQERRVAALVEKHDVH